MRFQPLPNTLYKDNRNRFTSKMEANSIAIFVSNEVLARNGDQSYWPYRPNSELFYLTGIAQEDTFLVLFPDSPIPNFKEILFVKETNEEIATWEGAKFSKEEASNLSGIKTVLWSHQFQSTLQSIINFSDSLYLNLNENDRANVGTNNAEHRFSNELKGKYPLHNFKRSATILREIRPVKAQEEINQLRKAISITNDGLHKVLKSVKPGMNEYEIEATLISHYISKGCNGFSFEPIIAGGKNACTLHYVANDAIIKDGDLILLDNGADYGYYSADLTRCFPANGKFTERQKQVYNSVLSVMRQSKELLTTKHSLQQYNMEAAKIMEAELLSLDLISKKDIEAQDASWPAYKKYFPHGTGHFLGIDIHDIGRRYEKLQAGMVITCEPGIYIKDEGIGIRIENDIVITNDKPMDLMVEVPIEVEEIEMIMNSGK